MTVQELIDELNKIEDKTLIVKTFNSEEDIVNVDFSIKYMPYVDFYGTEFVLL